MTTALRRAAVALVFVAVCVVSMPAAMALENEVFGLTPYPERSDGSDRRTFSIPLEPGTTFEDAVRIYNRTDQTLNLLVYAADAEAMLDDTITVGFKTSRPEGVGSWIDLAREDVALGPRAEIVVTFRVRVKNSDPEPDLGAIVVENKETGLASQAAQRLHVVVRTDAPNTSTTSVRVRPLLLRSPWVVVALIGLVVAAALVWVGARRARRPRDVVVPVGELEPDSIQESSLPVIKQLGAVEGEPASSRRALLERARAARTNRARDARPLIDDALLVEDEAGEEADESAVDEVSERVASAARAVRPAIRRARARPRPKDAAQSKAVPARKASAKKAKPATVKPKPATARDNKKKAAPAKKAQPKKTKAAQQQNFIPLKDL